MSTPTRVTRPSAWYSGLLDVLSFFLPLIALVLGVAGFIGALHLLFWAWSA
jgi:hypothetical protein